MSDTSRAVTVMGGVLGVCILWGLGALFFHPDIKPASRPTLYEAGAAPAVSAVVDGSTHDGPSQAEREARAAATWPDDQKTIVSNLDDAKKDRVRQDWTGAGAYVKLEDHYNAVTFIEGGRKSQPPNLTRRPVAIPKAAIKAAG